MSIVNDKMSETPETDAAIVAAGGDWSYYLGKCSRKLERERDEARTELEMWRDGNILHEIHRDELEKVERERDEAITRRMETIMQCELYEQERDEAIIELSKLKAALRQRFEEGK
jgi:hypothetical protein